jgi:glycosyltransferase involved in cell wall biosynthesis
MSPKITIITAVFNRATTVQTSIESVLNQRDANIEHIIIDGNSTDGTQEVVRRFDSNIAKFISEPDSGIYNALNKGIRAATGDVVGFLHADDMLANPNVIRSISDAFQDPEIDAAYGDLVYVDAQHPDQIVRYWKSGKAASSRFRRGWMPPHPTFYLRRAHYVKFGGYREDFHISADYELLLRMLFKHRLKPAYIEDVLVKMRLGGKSNVSMANRLLANREDRHAWEVNDLRPPFGLQLFKPLRKIYQYWLRPKK